MGEREEHARRMRGQDEREGGTGIQRGRSRAIEREGREGGKGRRRGKTREVLEEERRESIKDRKNKGNVLKSDSDRSMDELE